MPSMVGAYTILDYLGRGTTGAVYRAHDEEQGRLVAIKMPYTQDGELRVRIQRFIREVRVVAACRHPNIIRMYLVNETPKPYCVREYVEGQTFEQRVSTGSIGLCTGVRIVRDVACAIHAVNRQGIVHRNLHPANVLIGTNGATKLIGFSKARAVDDPPTTETLSDIPGLTGLLGWLCDSVQHPLLTPLGAIPSRGIERAEVFAEVLTEWLEKRKERSPCPSVKS